MAATVVPDRFHNAYTLAGAGSITPSILDNYALADASGSDANSKATARDLVIQWNRIRQRYMPRWFTDCINDPSADGTDKFVQVLSGAGTLALVQSNDTQGVVGHCRIGTGSTTSGTAHLVMKDNIVRLGGGTWFYECKLRGVSSLSSSAQGYMIVAGFMDIDRQNYAAWAYDERGTLGNAATYWQTITAAGGSFTYNSNHTQTTFATATWYRVGVEVNAAASSVAFYLDGTLQGTHTANIPSGSGQHLTFGIHIMKSSGVSSRSAEADYILGCCDLTSAR